MLINSCDKYHFLWPYLLDNLKNFKIYNLVDCVYLNNESFVMPIDGCKYISELRGAGVFPVNKWGDQIFTAVNAIKSDFILLTQDDYFFYTTANSSSFDDAYAAISNSDEIDCIHLSKYVRMNPSLDNAKYSSVKYGKYYLNTQLCLWRRESLLETLINATNPWLWELNGYKDLKREYNILAWNEPVAKYFALITKGKLSPNAENFVDEKIVSELDELLGRYKHSLLTRIINRIKYKLI